MTFGKRADLIAAMTRMAADADTQRWWAECVTCLVSKPGLHALGVWADAEEVYHLT